MEIQRLSGIVISAGFTLYIIAMLVAPPLYQETVIANRLTIIATNRTRWNISQLFFSLGIGLPAVGFLLFTFSERPEKIFWLYLLGAMALITGAGIGMWLVYRQTLDPEAFWKGVKTPLLIGYGYLPLTFAGLFCFGVGMLQRNFPNWLGYIMMGSAVLLSMAIVFLRGRGGFFVSVIAYLVTFVAGMVLLLG